VALERRLVSTIDAVAVADGEVALIGYASPEVNPEFINALAVPSVAVPVAY